MPGSSQPGLIYVSWWLPQLFFSNAHLFTAQLTVQLIHQSAYFEGCECCEQGFFASGNSSFISRCLPCSTCAAGQGIRVPCNESYDTVCETCKEGTYSAAGDFGPECVTCTDCLSHGRQEDSPCSQTQDGVCGKCAKGYFLYIDHEGSKCLPCSPCPEDQVAVHWIECAQAGLDQDYQCAPGEVPSSNSTNATSEPVNATATTEEPTTAPTSNHTTTPEPVDITIPTDRGGFVDQTESEPLTTAHPSEEIGIAITAASVVFTFTTLVVFSFAVGYVSRHACRKFIQVARHPKSTSSPLLEEGESSVDATAL